MLVAGDIGDVDGGLRMGRIEDGQDRRAERADRFGIGIEQQGDQFGAAAGECYGAGAVERQGQGGDGRVFRIGQVAHRHRQHALVVAVRLLQVGRDGAGEIEIGETGGTGDGIGQLNAGALGKGRRGQGQQQGQGECQAHGSVGFRKGRRALDGERLGSLETPGVFKTQR